MTTAVQCELATAALGDATVAVASRLAALRVDALTVRVGSTADLAMASPASTAVCTRAWCTQGSDRQPEGAQSAGRGG